MKAKEYPLMARCVEDGIAYGYTRAHKHTETPNEQLIKQEIYNAVMNEICECFDFDNEGKE